VAVSATAVLAITLTGAEPRLRASTVAGKHVPGTMGPTGGVLVKTSDLGAGTTMRVCVALINGGAVAVRLKVPVCAARTEPVVVLMPAAMLVLDAGVAHVESP
jgi:hypothetical protein